MRRVRARLVALPAAELRRLLVGLAVLTLVQSAFTVWLAASTEQSHDLAIDLVAVLVIGWSFAGTGLFAWWRRPANPVGPLMWLTGFCGARSSSGCCRRAPNWGWRASCRSSPVVRWCAILRM